MKVYEKTSLCRSLYAKGTLAVKAPALAYRHGIASGGQSVTGGVFLADKNVPLRYRGAYVYGDWESGWLRLLRFDATGRPMGDFEPFAAETSGPVAIENGPGGGLYYLAINASEVRRISYRPG